jgi:hypothetical protein
MGGYNAQRTPPRQQSASLSTSTEPPISRCPRVLIIMNQFNYPNGFDGRYYSPHYPHNQYPSPPQADEDRESPRRRNSTGREYRYYDHSSLRVEHEKEPRRTRSSRLTTDSKHTERGKTNIGPKIPKSRAGRTVGRERPPMPGAYGRRDLERGPLLRSESDSDVAVVGHDRSADGPKPPPVPRIAPSPIYSSHMRYGEYHVLASNPRLNDTSGHRIDGIGSRVVRQDYVPNARLRKSKKQKITIHEEAWEEEGSSSEPTLNQQSDCTQNMLSLNSSQEDEKSTPHRAAIPLRPSTEVGTQSYHGSLALSPRPRISTTKSFPKVQIPRFSVSHDSPDPSQSANFSISPGDSRSDTGTSKRRPMLGLESPITSTSFLSLPTSPTGSSVLGHNSYQYLRLGDMEFRLIRILPERMSKLKCEIVHRSLEDPPDYVAISYAWGDGVDTKLLVLQGATIPVAANLYDALKAIRQKKTEALVWVDALCIDQQNEGERATQVRLMGHIYSRAISVAIWLGPEADGSALAMQLLEQVAHNIVSPERIQSLGVYPDSAALFELFKRDYWKRLWVSFGMVCGL